MHHNDAISEPEQADVLWADLFPAAPAARQWAVALHGPIRSTRQIAAGIDDAADDLGTATTPSARWDAISRWVRALFERELDAQLRAGVHGWHLPKFGAFAWTVTDEELIGRAGAEWRTWLVLFAGEPDGMRSVS